MPVQHPPLAGGEERVQRPAEQAGGDDQRVHLVHRAALAGDVDLAPEALGADDQLGGDGEDQRGRRGDPQAGGDVGHRAHQRHAQDAVAAPDPERAARSPAAAGRGHGRRRSSGSAAARSRRTRPGRPCSAGPCRRRGSRAGSARPTGPGAGTRSPGGRAVEHLAEAEREAERDRDRDRDAEPDRPALQRVRDRRPVRALGRADRRAPRPSRVIGGK